MQNLEKWVAAHQERIDNLPLSLSIKYDLDNRFKPEDFCKNYLLGSIALKELNFSPKEIKTYRNKFSNLIKQYRIETCNDYKLNDIMWDLLDWVQWRKHLTQSDKYVNAFRFAEKHLGVRYGSVFKPESKIPFYKWLRTEKQIIYSMIRLSNLEAYMQSRGIA
jgi:hypothetical protein